MKSSIIFSFLFAAVFIAGCRKNDNPQVPDLTRVPLPLITLKDGSDTKISGTDPAAFQATFDVDTYYKEGDKPKQYDIVVIKNNDKSNPKVIQAGITTFPTTISITGQDLIDLFGEDIGLGDAFNIGANVITLDGKTYDAFPVGGSTYAPGISNLPGINTSLRFAAPCLFDPAAYTAGDYKVVFDEWNDYIPDDAAKGTVAVTKIDDTHYSFKYLVTSDAQPIVMVVDPADNSVSVASVVYGAYGTDFITAVGVPGGSSVDPCDVSFTVQLNHTYSGGDLGNYTIKFMKQ
jgi:hypothetical protein